MTLQEILESVKSGSVSVEEAERILKKESYEEMGYAKLDTSRKARTGFAEVIYCSNKADEHLLNIFERLYREDGEVFGTRASQHQYELVKEKFPEVEYDPILIFFACQPFLYIARFIAHAQAYFRLHCHAAVGYSRGKHA